MLDVDQAQEKVWAQVRPLETVRLSLREAAWRTLAEPIQCDVDYPPFDRSSMDGFAVRASQVASPPVTLKVVATVAAGSTAHRELRAGEAMQINTGAPIPPGADAVVRVEDAELAADGTTVVVKTAVQGGNFIVERGQYVRAGETVLKAGTRLTPLATNVAASAGAATVVVHRQPRVSVLSTGDELVDITRSPTGPYIRNSNEYLLEALVRSERAAAVPLGVARDERAALRERIHFGLSADMLCITGGVSVGPYDLVPSVLAEFGATLHVHKMAIKPGRPTIFATTPQGKPVFALPGNPASVLVGFELLVRPALAALEGRSGRGPVPCQAVLRGSLAAAGRRRSFLPAVAGIGEDGGWEVCPLSWQGSGDSFGMAEANALIMRPPGAAAAGDGEVVLMLRLEHD